MREELEILYAIDQYLRGELHGEKLLAFEERLKANPSLLNEIELQKSVNLLVHGVAYQEIRKKIRTDLKEIDYKRKIRNRFIGAFSFLIILLAGYYVVFKNPGIKVTSLNKLPVSKDTLYNNLKGYDLKPKLEIEPDSIKKLKSHDNSVTFSSKPDIKNTKTNSTSSAEILNTKSNDLEKVKPKNILTDKKENPKIINDQALVMDSNITPAKINPSELKQHDKVRTLSETVNCHDIFIAARPKVEATCSDVSEGKILFTDKISGGNSPYQISFNNDINFTDKTEFDSLGRGVYLFYIKDFNGCTSKMEVSVGEKKCIPNKFIINTTIGESWIVSEGNISYILKIYNKSGREILKKSSKEMPANEWRGEDNYGNILDSGLYIYIIEYSNGKIENGQISIVR